MQKDEVLCMQAKRIDFEDQIDKGCVSPHCSKQSVKIEANI